MTNRNAFSMWSCQWHIKNHGNESILLILIFQVNKWTEMDDVNVLLSLKGMQECFWDMLCTCPRWEHRIYIAFITLNPWEVWLNNQRMIPRIYTLSNAEYLPHVHASMTRPAGPGRTWGRERVIERDRALMELFHAPLNNWESLFVQFGCTRIGPHSALPIGTIV